jgi:diguanylate cyclase (GGDEF)-like protein
VLARLGGDEFVIMFSDARDRGIVDICGRIATAVDSRPIALPDGGSVRVSISCGVALQRPGISAEALLHEADLSLYQAKRTGRNRVILSRAA